MAHDSGLLAAFQVQKMSQISNLFLYGPEYCPSLSPSLLI
jgi:hypothetical protein